MKIFKMKIKNGDFIEFFVDLSWMELKLKIMENTVKCIVSLLFGFSAAEYRKSKNNGLPLMVSMLLANVEA